MKEGQSTLGVHLKLRIAQCHAAANLLPSKVAHLSRKERLDALKVVSKSGQPLLLPTQFALCLKSAHELLSDNAVAAYVNSWAPWLTAEERAEGNTPEFDSTEPMLRATFKEVLETAVDGETHSDDDLDLDVKLEDFDVEDGGESTLSSHKPQKKQQKLAPEDIIGWRVRCSGLE